MDNRSSAGNGTVADRPDGEMLQLIEDGIPIPPVVRIRSPLRDMKIGQSMLFTSYNCEDTVRKQAYNIGRELGWKFTARKMAEGIRIWRIA